MIKWYRSVHLTWLNFLIFLAAFLWFQSQLRKAREQFL